MTSTFAPANPRMETSEIYRRALEAIGPKKVAHALGLSLGHTYRLARPSMDVDPDGTGARSDLDRIETLIDLLAARPEGRPVLVALRSHLVGMLDRALGAWEGGALTEARLIALQARAIREVGEALVCCEWDTLEAEDARRELREAIAALEELDGAIAHGIDAETLPQMARRLTGRRAG